MSPALDKATGAELAFNFMESITELDSTDAVLARFRANTELFGYSTVVVGALPSASNKLPRFFLSTWSESFVDEYIGEGMVTGDPSVEVARDRALPALWSDLRGEWRAAGRSLRHFDLIRVHGFPEGMAIPIHGPRGYRGVVTLGGETRELPLRHRTALHLMALCAHERLKGLLAPELTIPADAIPRLSPGEIECIRWLIAGKSDWEMSEILGIAEATAHWRIEQAKKKLSVKTRAQLTALAVHYGLVRP